VDFCVNIGQHIPEINGLMQFCLGNFNVIGLNLSNNNCTAGSGVPQGILNTDLYRGAYVARS
jgi:hypothetical protein